MKLKKDKWYKGRTEVEEGLWVDDEAEMRSVKSGNGWATGRTSDGMVVMLCVSLKLCHFSFEVNCKNSLGGLAKLQTSSIQTLENVDGPQHRIEVSSVRLSV